jgi:hypothetical protein
MSARRTEDRVADCLGYRLLAPHRPLADPKGRSLGTVYDFRHIEMHQVPSAFDDMTINHYRVDVRRRRCLYDCRFDLGE